MSEVKQNVNMCLVPESGCVGLLCMFCLIDRSRHFVLPIGGGRRQDHLMLSVSNRHFAQWIPNQWHSWKQFITDIDLDGDELVASAESRNKRVRRDPDNASLSQEFVFTEWAASSSALVALLCRWSTSLQPRSRLQAVQVLDAVITAAVPETLLIWWFGDGDSMDTSVGGITKIIIYQRNVDLTMLRDHSAEVNRLLRRSFA
eukprot:11201934-Lingulodinium_polyedra.AAC.1